MTLRNDSRCPTCGAPTFVDRDGVRKCGITRWPISVAATHAKTTALPGEQA